MIINATTQLGGATYPFLHRLGRPWMIHAWDVDDEARQHYNAPIALRWVNGNTVNDLYIEGMDSRAFLAATGLRPQMINGGFVLSKRISRIMRPYFMSAFFERDAITVQYLDQTDRDATVWDGAGRVRRSVLRRVLEQMPDLPGSKQAEMTAELTHARRIEFTMMGMGQWSDHCAGGQDKGHAMSLRMTSSRPTLCCRGIPKARSCWRMARSLSDSTRCITPIRCAWTSKV